MAENAVSVRSQYAWDQRVLKTKSVERSSTQTILARSPNRECRESQHLPQLPKNYLNQLATLASNLTCSGTR